jgi:hypothetical protein
MNKNIFLAIALCGCGFTIKAQCDKGKVRYISHKTENLDSLKKVQDTRDETVTVEVTKTGISIIPGDNPDEMLAGSFTDISCLWKDAFINGKTIIKTKLVDPHGDGNTATITIEGAAGKITILVEVKEFPDKKLRLLVDKHEELN